MRRKWADKVERIHNLLQKGYTVQEIAKQLGVNDTLIYNVLRYYGLKSPSKRILERAKTICELFKQGVPMREIAKRFNISKVYAYNLRNMYINYLRRQGKEAEAKELKEVPRPPRPAKPVKAPPPVPPEDILTTITDAINTIMEVAIWDLAMKLNEAKVPKEKIKQYVKEAMAIIDRMAELLIDSL